MIDLIVYAHHQAVLPKEGGRSDYLLQSDRHDAIDVFGMVPSKMSRRATSGPYLKTSFSRSNPRMRGQATSTRTAIRQKPKLPNNHRSLRHRGLPRSGSIFSSQCRQNRHQLIRAMQTLFSSKTRQNNGGAERDRTADLRSAIAALSQLSYGPEPSISTPNPLVELSGIEPLTPCLQSRCSPS